MGLTVPWSTAGSALTVELSSRAIVWRLIRWLNVSRAILAGLLFILFLTHRLPGDIGSGAPTLFLWVTVFYFLFSVAISIAIARRRPNLISQTIVQLSGDIVAIGLLMYASTGVNSGLGAVLVVPVVAGALILSLRAALGFAAVATIIILVQESLVTLGSLRGGSHYAQAGLLGAVFFAIAIVGHALVRRLRESEIHAAQRGVDLANMAVLNDYIIQQLRAGVIVLDGDDTVVMTNPAAINAVGALGALDDRTPLALAAPRLKAMLDVWRHGTRPENNLTLTATDDTLFIPHFSQLGPTPTAGTIIFLENADQAAEQVRQMKLASLGRLTGSIAHEIRNPLGAIAHANQIMAESADLSDQNRRLSDIVHNHSARVNNIVENILKLSRAETPHVEHTNLCDWLHAFAAEFRADNALDDSAIRVTVPRNATAPHARVDTSQLYQIIRNLADNALRYGLTHNTPRYGERALVEFSLNQRPLKRQSYIDVLDRGPGIAAELTSHLFEPFYTSSNQGTGLGLFIARELCECNRATLSYHARAEGGSCFRVTFPDPQSWIT